MSHAIPPANSAGAVFTDVVQFPNGWIEQPGFASAVNSRRIDLVSRPGFQRKLAPLRTDDTGVYSGGAYLFDTYENAVAFQAFCSDQWVSDAGLRVVDQPHALELGSHVWKVVGAEDLAQDVTKANVMRFERWALPRGTDEAAVREGWETILASASAAGLSGIWLLYAPHPFHPQMGVVMTTSDAVAAPDLPDLTQLEGIASPASEPAAALKATRIFNRTSWIFSIFLPLVEGAPPSDSVAWPLTPPLPGLLPD